MKNYLKARKILSTDSLAIFLSKKWRLRWEGLKNIFLFFNLFHAFDLPLLWRDIKSYNSSVVVCGNDEKIWKSRGRKEKQRIIRYLRPIIFKISEDDTHLC